MSGSAIKTDAIVSGLNALTMLREVCPEFDEAIAAFSRNPTDEAWATAQKIALAFWRGVEFQARAQVQ